MKVLAVTACPVGIAHTYMAAENLQKAGEEIGYRYKSGNTRINWCRESINRTRYR